MRRAGVIDDVSADEAAAEPLPTAARPSRRWPGTPPARLAARRARSTRPRCVTTLDAGLQARLEAPGRATPPAPRAPTTTAAILVVETEDPRRCAPRSAPAGLDRPGGWIDMTRALRSPGSALKPFIYAFAFDDGVAAPDTEIDDAPRRFADYQPENFDRVFHGKVTAREALMHSLNVPGRRHPGAASAPRPSTRGWRAPASSSCDRASATARAGLALALGGAGITLRDLAVLYAALGDGGVAKPLAWTEDDGRRARRGQRGSRLVAGRGRRPGHRHPARDAAAARAHARRPDARAGPRIAFKTGTSYGFRDALAAGVVGGHVVVVWTGRADGGARGGLTGRDAALPLLFDVCRRASTPRPPRRRPSRPRGAPAALTTLRERATTGRG